MRCILTAGRSARDNSVSGENLLLDVDEYSSPRRQMMVGSSKYMFRVPDTIRKLFLMIDQRLNSTRTRSAKIETGVSLRRTLAFRRPKEKGVMKNDVDSNSPPS
jgi:hypothetical protein